MSSGSRSKLRRPIAGIRPDMDENARIKAIQAHLNRTERGRKELARHNWLAARGLVPEIDWTMDEEAFFD